MIWLLAAILLLVLAPARKRLRARRELERWSDHLSTSAPLPRSVDTGQEAVVIAFRADELINL